MRLLVVTATERETAAVAGIDSTTVIESGIGRTNAACATTEALVQEPYDAVISAGVAGALPASGLVVGDALVASSCVYAEEGLVTPGGFAGVESIGFALGDFDGNTVPVDETLRDTLNGIFRIGGIATVATCSGTDGQARMIAERTRCLAEAMEGAAVVHAARRRGVPAIEIRTISNFTGDRANQQWDLPRALSALTPAMHRAAAALRKTGIGP